MAHFEGDLRDAEAIARVVETVMKPEIVFHLAAQALVRPAYADPKGTFDTNVGGAVNLLEAIRHSDSVAHPRLHHLRQVLPQCRLGMGLPGDGHSRRPRPLFASKGCAEIVFDAYWNSFLKGRLRAATNRAGNVIGGGDWAKGPPDPRLHPLPQAGRDDRHPQPDATRPWQHVLEPLGGYLLLGARLEGAEGDAFCKSWNLGPGHGANRTVEEVVRKVIGLWGGGELSVQRDPNAPPRGPLASVNTDRASHYLKWEPVWGYEDSVTETVRWYRAWHEGADIPAFTASQIAAYQGAWAGLGRP